MGFGKAGQCLFLREFSRILPLCWYPLFIFAEIYMLTYPPTHRETSIHLCSLLEDSIRLGFGRTASSHSFDTRRQDPSANWASSEDRRTVASNSVVYIEIPVVHDDCNMNYVK